MFLLCINKVCKFYGQKILIFKSYPKWVENVIFIVNDEYLSVFLQKMIIDTKSENRIRYSKTCILFDLYLILKMLFIFMTDFNKLSSDIIRKIKFKYMTAYFVNIPKREINMKYLKEEINEKRNDIIQIFHFYFLWFIPPGTNKEIHSETRFENFHSVSSENVLSLI